MIELVPLHHQREAFLVRAEMTALLLFIYFVFGVFSFAWTLTHLVNNNADETVNWPCLKLQIQSSWCSGLLFTARHFCSLHLRWFRYFWTDSTCTIIVGWITELMLQLDSTGHNVMYCTVVRVSTHSEPVLSVCDKGGSGEDDLVAFQKWFFMCFQIEIFLLHNLCTNKV